MLRQRQVRQGLPNSATRELRRQAGTSTGRVDWVVGQAVNLRGGEGARYERHLYNQWTVREKVFNLLSRIHVVLILIYTCLLGMVLIPSIKFLAHNTGLKLSQLEGRLVGNGCSLRSKFPHQEIRR